MTGGSRYVWWAHQPCRPWLAAPPGRPARVTQEIAPRALRVPFSAACRLKASRICVRTWPGRRSRAAQAKWTTSNPAARSFASRSSCLITCPGRRHSGSGVAPRGRGAILAECGALPFQREAVRLGVSPGAGLDVQHDHLLFPVRVQAGHVPVFTLPDLVEPECRVSVIGTDDAAHRACAASVRAVAAPMPEDAPVTTATRSCCWLALNMTGRLPDRRTPTCRSAFFLGLESFASGRT